MANKKMVLPIIATFSAMALASCGGDKNQTDNPVDTRDANIVAVYNAYRAKAQRDGTTVLDYDTWLATIKGETGATGPAGKSAYEVAVDQGFTGTADEWLASLVGASGAAGGAGEAGKSAYQIAVSAGFTGTETDWLQSLKGANGAAGQDGTPGQDGAPGKSAFDIFMEHYPHFTGTEAEWIRMVADGTMKDNMPKAGHSGDWSYDASTGKITRTCLECGEIETKDAILPAFVDIPVTDSGIEGLIEITNDSEYPWTFANGVWKSSNQGVNSSDSILNIKSLVAGTTLKYHVHASGEGSSTLWDYFSGSVTVGASSTLGGTRVGTPSGQDKDVVVTFTDANADTGLSFHKDNGGTHGGDDEAVVTDMMFSAPIDFVDSAMIPEAVVVNFDADNGDADTQQIIWVENGVELPTPTKAGYDFDGWFADEACTVPAPTTFSANCTLHAKWVKTHVVTIADMTPGADDTVVMVRHNATLDIESPTSDTHIFGGFFVAPSCAPGTEFDIASPIKRDTFIYCKWNEAPAYCGTYNGANIYNGGAKRTSNYTLKISPTGEITGKYTGRVASFEDGIITMDGSSDKLYVFDDFIIGASNLANDSDLYIFSKGLDTVSSTNPVFDMGITDGTCVPSSSKNRLFRMTIDGVEKTFLLKDGVITPNVTVTSLDGTDPLSLGMSMGTKATDSATSYYLKDVCVKNADGDVLVAQILGKNVDDDYGIYIDAESHVLKVYGDGSQASLDGEAITYTKEGSDIVFTEYSSRKTVTTYTGSTGYYASDYTMEWNSTKSCWVYVDDSSWSTKRTDTPYTDPEIVWRVENSKFVFGEDVVAGNAHIVLDGDAFEINRPEFTVAKHVGDATENVTKREGCTIELGEPEIAENQAFLGWFTNTEFTGDPVTEMTAAGDVYAKIVTTFKMTVHKNLTDVPSVSEDILFNEGVMMTPPTVTKDGADLVGWFTNEGCTEAYVPAAAAADVEIWAKWEAGKYTNNAANFLDKADPSGEYIDSIDFDGVNPWTKDTFNNGETDIEAMKSGNGGVASSTSTIGFTVKKACVLTLDTTTSGEGNYDYGFITVNGTEVGSTKGKSSSGALYNESFTLILSANDVVTFNFKKDSSGDKNLDAFFVYNLVFANTEEVTVTRHINDGVTPDEIVMITKGAKYTPADPTARTGFAFMGWFTDEALTTPFNATAALTGDVDLYAKWFDLSVAVGTTRDAAVVANTGDYDKAAGYTAMTLVPGQTDLWFTVTITEENKRGGTPYVYITGDDMNGFKNNNFVKQETFIGDSTDAAKTQTSSYISNGRLYAGAAGDSGLLNTVGNVVTIHLTLKNITNVTNISVIFYA